MDTDKLKSLQSQMRIEPEPLSTALEESIRSCTKNLEREGAILGISGGVDSAVTAALCARAVGSEKTLALIMPDRDSKKEHINDAIDLANKLKIRTKIVKLSPLLKKLGVYKLFFLNKLPLPGKLKSTLALKAHSYFESKRGETPFSASLLGISDTEFDSYLKSSNAYYRIKHRLRMALLYLYGELDNRLIVGAANKSEYSIGFFVKYGCDHAVDVMPLLGLYKTQVFELARYLGIPSKIIGQPPSPDIVPGITDEKAIGLPYEKLDLILLALEKGWQPREVSEVLKIEEETVLYVRSLIKKSEHMRRIY